jgi:hypothetical protein
LILEIYLRTALAVTWGFYFAPGYIEKNRPLWKQGSQPKLTAYENIDCFYNKNYNKQIMYSNYTNANLLPLVWSSLLMKV